MILHSVFIRHLTCYTWHVTSDTDTWHVILDIWFMTPALSIYTGIRYLQALDMLYLIPDPQHLILDTGTWYVILDTWSWHPVYNMLSCGTSTLTWYCDTWPDIITLDTCIILHIHDYHFYRDLAWLLYYYQTFDTPELLCSWTLVYLNP